MRLLFIHLIKKKLCLQTGAHKTGALSDGIWRFLTRMFFWVQVLKKEKKRNTHRDKWQVSLGTGQLKTNQQVQTSNLLDPPFISLDIYCRALF